MPGFPLKNREALLREARGRGEVKRAAKYASFAASGTFRLTEDEFCIK